LKGLPLDEAEKIFSMAAYGKEIVIDKIWDLLENIIFVR
jgi:hypothetical protein